MDQAIVTQAHTRSYDNPIGFSRGDPVTLTGRSDVWAGHVWVWAMGPDGREGWIPPSCVVNGIALRDYSARELTVSEGDVLRVVSSESGWCWCVDKGGLSGWVPCDKLHVLSASPGQDASF